MAANLVMELAQRRLERYAAGPLPDAAGDCNQQVRAAIEAYRWLRRADDVMREAAYEGLIELSPEHQRSVAALLQTWLERGENLLARLRSPQISSEHLDEFQRVFEEATELAESLEWLSVARRGRELWVLTDQD